MRNIKIRVWGKDQKDWLSPTLTNFAIDGQIRFADLRPSEYEVDVSLEWKDDDGKEIFEGDILRCRMEGIDSDGIITRSGFVDYEPTDAQWVLDMGSSMIALASLNERNAEYKVVGNIHQNFEILQ